MNRHIQNDNHRFLQSVWFLCGLMALGLLGCTGFRLTEFFALHGMMSENADGTPYVAFVRGLWFDTVVACYILILPISVVLLAASVGWYQRGLRRFAVIWAGAFYTVVFAISASNIPYYAYFAKNINSSIFNWFSYADTTTGMILGERSWWIYIGMFLVVLTLYIWIINRWLAWSHKRIASKPKGTPRWQYGLWSVLLIGLCVFGIRGRIGYNPIKISQSYYCNDPFLNQLGIAPAFNLLTSVLDDMRPENRELKLMPYDEAITQTRRLLSIEGQVDSAHVLARHIPADSVQRRPNIVVILMESMSGALLQTLGQQKRLTPTLDSLYGCSWAFTNFYSAGIHTNHGITATLYSFPALMKRNLMKGTVTPRRHGLPTVLKDLGYHNMFFMTHESQYDNMNAFLHTNGYDDVYAQEDYPSSERVNAFGVSDHYLFDFGLEKINEEAKKGKPWMATLLTISNHPPYMVPEWFEAQSEKEELQIVEYSDWCIGNFLAKARQQNWYKNTLFVILADHGKIVGPIDSDLPESYNHIPLVIFGPGVKAEKTDHLATQVDVMPTILGIMGVEYDFEGFGVNLLHQQRDMVFYTADDQVAARDQNRRFLHIPATGQTFYEGCDKQHADDLQRYVFSMVQTAEYMQRQEKQE